MNDNLERCLYEAGLTAQGCWDELDDYAKQGIEKFAKLIALECIKMVENEAEQYVEPTWAVELVDDMYEHFGVTK
jgi:TRAP-type C4-dicarboxylate transport system substrate-binding protein